MALIKCPECQKDVSSAANTCPNCGYPIREYADQILFDSEVKRLTDKIKPCDFQCPEPRVKVCIKCGSIFNNYGNINVAGQNTPSCDCHIGKFQFPGVDIDYPLMQYDGIGTELYILDEVISRNIGDSESEEFQKNVSGIHSGLARVKKINEAVEKGLLSKLCMEQCDPVSPRTEMFGVKPSSDPIPEVVQSYIPPHPKCPYCGSDHLSKISTVKKAAKIELFGLFGAGDLGKTWRCDNCGGKF